MTCLCFQSRAAAELGLEAGSPGSGFRALSVAQSTFPVMVPAYSLAGVLPLPRPGNVTSSSLRRTWIFVSVFLSVFEVFHNFKMS